jgi:hypothetical protein
MRPTRTRKKTERRSTMSAKRTVVEQKFKKMEAEAKRLGVILLTKQETFIDDDHLDCTWYGGYIGGLRYKGYEVSIEVHGDVEITGFMNGRDFLYKNKQNTGAMNMAVSDALRTTFKSDDELVEAVQDGDIEYENNNWIEAFVKKPNGSWSTASEVAEDDNVLDVCADISCWLDWLKANFIKEAE